MEWIDVKTKKPEGVFWAWIKGRYEGQYRDAEIIILEDKYSNGDYRTLDEAGSYSLEDDSDRYEWDQIIAWLPYDEMIFPKRKE